MSDLRTPRLRLHPIDLAEGERILSRCPGPEDHWAADYPFDGDILAVTMFLRASAEHGKQRPFGYYRISRVSDGKAIGGIGFKAPPESGSVEVGYGLAESARGRGFAAEALTALLQVAAEHDLARVVADTAPDNIASQRTLLRAGFRPTRTDDDAHHYEALLGPGRGACARRPG